MALSKERQEVADLIILTLQETPELAFSANQIAKKIGVVKQGNRNTVVTQALKWLKWNKKIVQFSSGAKGPGSTYAISKTAVAARREIAPITKQEAQETLPLNPYPAQAYKPQPVCTIEVPKATLKALVKAVMASCQPMDTVLQRAVLQCMEKLI